ncbi:hypothetical protein WJX75_000399 [Coccomyxa subellipsoidea]|uniref:RNI-like protein n=1 Tax=Coccomyxa subellipsoidea TaxID=248742 RepID=A0ABR2YUQ7_9CHLO
MGQYWDLFNLTKRETVSPRSLGSGVKLYEITNNRPGVPVALLLLVAAIPGVKHPIVGRWAGDRIALIGDYAEEDDMAPEVWDGAKPNDFKEYFNISYLHFSLCTLDLKEALHTSTLGMGAPVNLCELAQVKHGFSDILIYLAASFPKKRGGGDFDEHPTIGRWAGHRIALHGDGGPRNKEVLQTSAEVTGQGLMPAAVKAPIAQPTKDSTKISEDPSGARVQPCREVLTAVVARLEEPADVGAMRLVSKAWNAAASDGTVTARLSKFATGDRLIWLVAHFPNLQRLDASGVDFITNDVPEFNRAIPDMDQRRERFKQTLTEFSLAKYIELEESAASDLAAFSNMARLNLKDVEFQGDWMCHIQGLTRLVTLHITGGKGFTEDHFSLGLNGCKDITDEGLSVLTELRKLRSLELKDCSKLSDEALKDLQSKLPALVDIQSGASPRDCSIC